MAEWPFPSWTFVIQPWADGVGHDKDRHAYVASRYAGQRMKFDHATVVDVVRDVARVVYVPIDD